MLVGDIWRNPLIDLTNSAKMSCKVLNYGAIPDQFLNLRSPKMEQRKGIDVLKNQLSDTNFVAPAGGRYLKKTSHWVD